MDAEIVVITDAFDADLAELTSELGFRVDMIRPADAPTTAVVSGHGLRLRLRAGVAATPVAINLVTDEPGDARRLPGGSTVTFVPRTTTIEVPENRPVLTIVRGETGSGVGRAGMRYRDLLPGRWGGRFESSLITIPEGGPVPDYVHFHKIRFQMIFVKSGWVRLVYEDQGEPFVAVAGDCVLQPPEIRHRVLESSPGLEVIEIGCPADHETIADWSLPLPTGASRPERAFGGQRFVRHIAAEAEHHPWRIEGWEYRDTGIGDATGGLAGARVARPVAPGAATTAAWCTHASEFAQLVVLSGRVTFDADDVDGAVLSEGDSVAIPSSTRYRLRDAGTECELLDVTLPASVECGP